MEELLKKDLATIDVEKNILGNYLNNKDVRHIIPVKLNHKDFLNSTNRELFIIISDIIKQTGDVDENILRTSINNGPYKDKNGLLKRLDEILLEAIYIDNIDTYISYLTKASIINKLRNFYNSHIEYIENEINIEGLESYLENTQTEFLDIINSRVTSDLKDISEFVDDFIQKQEIIKSNRGKLTGIDTGFKSLNKVLNGFQPGELIILAARPSIGKTALAINFAYNASKIDSSKTTVIYSLEMSADQLLQRLVSSSTRINYRDFQENKLDQAQIYSWNKQLSDFKTLDIKIDEKMDSTILDIQAGLRDLKKTKEIGLVIIDYLQLINTNDKHSNRNQEVAKISRTLKMIAKELKVPVIAVAQLSRNIEQRNAEDRKPKLSDLRESGAIEQDADVVMFLDYDRTQIDQSSNSESNVKFASNVVVDLVIAKNRNGETGIIKLNFDKRTGRYDDHSND
ncbi:MAG: replicative DNA helicase [Ureaplasma sp.]|nr:replicative DNA helicase [Ureaplasma sp.]